MIDGQALPEVDVFVSYTKEDQAWAEWISWCVTSAGYSVELDRYHWLPGQNFVTMMDGAIDRARRVLAVCSPAYFRSRYAWAELTATFVAGNLGPEHLLLVRVEPCDIPSLLRPLIYVDLDEVDESTAAERLLAAMSGNVERSARGTRRHSDAGRSPTYPGRKAAGTWPDGVIGLPVDYLNRFVAGSTRITLDRLSSPGGPRIAFPWRYREDSKVQPGDLLGHLADTIGGNSGPGGLSPSRYVVLAASGMGKTTLGLLLYAQVTSRPPGTRPPLIYLDLRSCRDGRDDPDFGTRGWVMGQLQDVDKGSQAYRENDPQVILDGLDEFLGGLDRRRIFSLLDRWIFTVASVILCRTAFYDKWLAATEYSSRFTEVEMPAWDDRRQRDFIENYYPRSPTSEVLSAETASLSQWIGADERRSELYSNPLRLSILLDLVHSDPTLVAHLTSGLNLYELYTDRILSRESSVPSSVLDAAEKTELLKQLAWEFFDEEGEAADQAHLFTRRELDELLGRLLPDRVEEDRRDIADDLEQRSLLTGGRSGRADLPGTLSFAHASFQDYFVANYVVDSLRYGRDTVATMGRFLSPEIGNFLVEHFLRSRRSATRLGALVANCVAAFKKIETTESGDEFTRARLRIARQQLGYYLGAMGHPRSTAFIRGRLVDEADLWVRRGMVIGLAISGTSEPLDRHIESLREERRNGGHAPACAVNFGYHLSFHGDQPLDLLQPDHDLGLRHCSRTVRALVRQLEHSHKGGVRRSTLFTLVDLSLREESTEEYWATLAARRDALARVVGRLKNDQIRANWPETAETELLLSRLDASDESR